MKIAVLIVTLVLSACGGSSLTEQEKVQKTYDGFSESSLDNLCKGVEMLDREMILSMIMAPPNEHTREYAELMYTKLEEEC